MRALNQHVAVSCVNVITRLHGIDFGFLRSLLLGGAVAGVVAGVVGGGVGGGGSGVGLGLGPGFFLGRHSFVFALRTKPSGQGVFLRPTGLPRFLLSRHSLVTLSLTKPSGHGGRDSLTMSVYLKL